LNKIFLAHIAALIASLSAGAAVVATRFVIGETDPVSLAFYRYLIGTVCFVPLLPFIWPKHRIELPEFGKIAVLGILFFCLFTWAFNASLDYIPAARGAVGLATAPIQTLIVAATFGRETMTFRRVVSVAIAFVGIAIVFGPEALNVTSSNYFVGDTLMLLGVFCAAVYSVFSRPTLLKHGPIFVTALAMMFGALTLFLISLSSTGFKGFPNFSPNAWGAVLFLGTFAGAIQFGLFTWALRWLSPTTVALYITLNPIAAMTLGILLIDETVTTRLIIGLLLVLSAILLSTGILTQSWNRLRQA